MLMQHESVNHVIGNALVGKLAAALLVKVLVNIA